MGERERGKRDLRCVSLDVHSDPGVLGGGLCVWRGAGAAGETGPQRTPLGKRE